MSTKQRVRLFVFALLLGTLNPAQAQRVALLIGNANYSASPLSNPPNDVKHIEAALKQVGFKVQTLLNANQNQMKRALRDFGDSAQGADVAFLYYSGHGTQANGENYLIPLQANINKESDYEIEAVGANGLMRQIAGARPKAAIVVLDACRDNPYASATKSTSKGLGRMDAPTGTMIAFATAPNTTASDEGYYAKELARQITTPGNELYDVFRNTTAEVQRLSKGKQVPRVSEVSITEKIYLAGQGTQLASVTPVPTGIPDKPTPGAATDPETGLWNEVKASGSQEYYEAYLQQYPKGKYTALARLELKKLVDQRKTQQQQQEQSAWESAKTADTLSGYEQYVNQYPAGKYVSLARAAITRIERLAKEQVRPGKSFKDCADCPEMVVIPAGNGISTFALGQTEVTQGQWQTLMGNNPSNFKSCGSECPVENVSWNDAQQFIQKLNAKTGKSYRLPTVQEWSHACLAGRSTEYCGGDNIDAVAWYQDNSNNTIHRVRTKQANGFGLFDMSGNVFEWQDNYYCFRNDCNMRVISGGSSESSAKAIHGWTLPSTGAGWNPNMQFKFFGFRLASTVP